MIKFAALLLASLMVSSVVVADVAIPPMIAAPKQALNNVLESRVAAKISGSFGQQVKVKEVLLLANQQVIEAVLADGSVIHLTPDLTHMVYRGELFELLPGQPLNITKNRNNDKRQELMAALDEKQLVIFKAKGEEKSVINVFTDIDCGYCRKLHNEVGRLNDLGVTVRYLAYPRAGVTDSRTGELTGSFKKINRSGVTRIDRKP